MCHNFITSLNIDWLLKADFFSIKFALSVDFRSHPVRVSNRHFIANLLRNMPVDKFLQICQCLIQLRQKIGDLLLGYSVYAAAALLCYI